MKRAKHSRVVIAAEHAVAAKTAVKAAQIFESVTATGYVDIYGYSIAAGGWFFSGWIPRPFRTDQPDAIDGLTQFEQSHFKGGVTLAFYQREDLDHTRIGVIAFASGSSRAAGTLRGVSFAIDGVVYQVLAGNDTAHLQDREIVERIRVTLVNQAYTNRSREHLLAVSSRPRFAGQDTLSALSEPVLLEIDEALLCPPNGVLLKGWLIATPGTIRSIRVRSGPLTAEMRLADSIVVARPDVIAAVGQQWGFTDIRCGFVAYVPAAVSAGDTAYIEVELESGEVGFRKLTVSKRSGLDAVRRILDGIDVRYGELDAAFDKVLGPAVFAINAARLKTPAVATQIEFGVTPRNPKYSLIVPLYGRVDFLEYQMALFSQHRAVREMEMIYVLDDPSRRRELEVLAQSTFERFSVPLRLLLLPVNTGFAPANNVGLRSASGQFVCFLNSDVFPITENWLERLVARLEECPDIGVIGARLLFEDGSIQHEGCFYRTIPEFGNWTFVEHFNKGRRADEMQGLRRCDVITGACMVLKRTLAMELDGFDESYIIGDFEDADICRRVSALGLASAVDNGVQLYHLERKSQVGPGQNWRMNLTLYNAWVHERRWCNGPIA